MSNWEWNEFGKLRTYEDLEDYLQGREYQHSNYFHYTSLANLNSILGSKQFWISNVSNFNDNVDKGTFGKGKELLRYFSVCFSTGIHENLPLWYLYSGMDGKGGRIRFTRTAIQKLIENAEYKLCEKNDGMPREIRTLDDSCMKKQFKDVLYFSDNNQRKSNVALKYNTMTNYNINVENFQRYKGSNRGFCKSLIWYYEKETRLLISLNEEIVREMTSEKNYIITMSLDESIIKKAEIKLAPEIKEVEEVFRDNANIYNHLKQSSKVQLSDYHGQMCMNLCDKCNKNNN